MNADSEHIELLRRGPRFWNEWRAENPSITPNLVGVTLSIGDRQMGPINGGPIDLAYARLRHAFLRFATLTGANLQGADLADTDLREARLEGANLAGADLSGAVLTGADLADADLTSANLCGADLSDVRNVTVAQLHAAEGDKTTILPASVDRPLIWTVAQIDDARPAVIRPETQAKDPRVSDHRPEPRHREEQRQDAAPAATRAAPRHQSAQADGQLDTSRHITWLVGGPRRAGRGRGNGADAGETGGR